MTTAVTDSKKSVSSTLRTRARKAFPIVGIGASAGGLEALTELIKQLPKDFGMAVVVIQHLDPTHISQSVDILSRTAAIPVTEAKDGIKAHPGSIYLIPPNCNLSLKKGAFKLSPRDEVHGLPMPIDFFFQSLAEDKKERAVGVVLSGTGSDGTLGLRAIKAMEGITFAQDPQTAKHDGMPRSAIDSGVVDLVLSPVQIAQELARITQHPLIVRESKVPTLSVATTVRGNGLSKIFELLQHEVHVDFSHYKTATLQRRISRRMALHKMKKFEDYVGFLESNPQEVRALFDEFLINVTEFFRDPEIFRSLKKQIFPKIMKNKSPKSPLRIWVIGCATGEEAYSVAISWLEYLGSSKTPLQIFATDLSETAIQKARAGVYPEAIRKQVSEDQLRRYFVKTESGYKISKYIRDMCLFSKHDVTCDPPFTKLDMICCRNLLIYFDPNLQKHVFSLLHYALNSGGFLWLGRSESVNNSRLFRMADKSRKFFWRLAAQTSLRLHSGPSPYKLKQKAQQPEHKLPEPEISKSLDLKTETDMALISEYAPPGVVVNDNMEIVLARGDTSPYLKLPPGQASLNLFRMANAEIVPNLRIAVQGAKKRNTRIDREGLSLSDGKYQRYFNLSVIPLKGDLKSSDRHFLICFEQIPEKPPDPLGTGSKTSLKGKPIRHPTLKSTLKAVEQRDRQIKKLERELTESRIYQQSLVEDFESTKEEITSTNEELQSTYEELQSTNEELETAKEELQSTNEELTTVNDELQNRNLDLTQVNNDLNNLLGTVELPIIMLSKEGRIRRFTPIAGKILNLIPNDVGRLIGDINSGFEKLDLQTVVSKVTETIEVQEQEVRNREGQWYRLQARPYKTADNRIDGAVVSLIDIAALKERLEKSEAALKYATSVADTFPLPLLVLDERLGLISANLAFTKMFKVDAVKGIDFLKILGRYEGNTHGLWERLSDVIGKNKALTNLEAEFDVPELGKRIMLLNAQKIDWQDVTMPKALLLSIEDITERRILERSLEHSEERFRRVVESAHDAIIIVNSKEVIEFANQRVLQCFGYEPDEIVGRPLDTLIPDRVRNAHHGYHKMYSANPISRPMGAGIELFGRRKDGSEIPVDISLNPIKSGGETRVTAIIRDISETKKLANERKALLDQEKTARTYAEHAKLEAEHANEAKDVFLATLSHELRTPLTAILSWSQLLERTQMSPEKLKQGISTIKRSAQAQAQLINDLLDISRIQSGKLVFNMSEVSPAEVVRSAVESIRPMAGAKKITVEVLDGADIGMVRGDPGRLQQVLWNLLTNAIKFSAEGSQVQVYVEKIREHNRSYASIRVVDHGKGIDADFLPNIFARFSQQDSSSTRVHGGLGIGLALVHDLVKTHDGSVKAESAGPGLGATFTVLIPLVKEKAPQTLPPMEEKSKEAPEVALPDLSGLKILIVEDEPASLGAFAEIVKSFGGSPTQCSSVREAMAVFEALRPDVVVSDIGMPVEDGFVLIRKIRALTPEQGGHVPALALTAFAAKQDVTRATEAGFQEHMAKPFDNEGFGRAIARLAGRSS